MQCVLFINVCELSKIGADVSTLCTTGRIAE